MQSSEKNHILHCSVFEGEKLRTLVADPDLSISWTIWIISIIWSILNFTLSRGVSRDLLQSHWTFVSGIFLGEARNRCEMWKNIYTYLHMWKKNNTGDLQRALVLLQSIKKNCKTGPGLITTLRSEFPLTVVRNERFILKNWKPLHKWKYQGTSLHHWNQYPFNLQADIPYTQKIKLGCLKLQP